MSVVPLCVCPSLSSVRTHTTHTLFHLAFLPSFLFPPFSFPPSLTFRHLRLLDLESERDTQVIVNGHVSSQFSIPNYLHLPFPSPPLLPLPVLEKPNHNFFSGPLSLFTSCAFLTIFSIRPDASSGAQMHNDADCRRIRGVWNCFGGGSSVSAPSSLFCFRSSALRLALFVLRESSLARCLQSSRKASQYSDPFSFSFLHPSPLSSRAHSFPLPHRTVALNPNTTTKRT